MAQHNRAKRSTATKNEANALQVTVEEAESHSLYPSPEMVKAFEEIQPGSADRILKIVENEQIMHHEAARHQMVEITKINDANIKNQAHNSKLFAWGLAVSVLMAAGILTVSVYALHLGYPWVASIGFGTLAAILTILVLRQVPTKTQHSDTQQNSNGSN